MPKPVGILLDRRYYAHAIDRPSPENPERLRGLYAELESGGNGHNGLVRFAPREATEDEVQYVHSAFYLQQVRNHACNGNPFAYDRDTYLMEETLHTAYLAAGGCLEMADRILCGEMDHAFALIRPPGHHAEAGRGMGFCVLNNVAIAAEYLRRRYGLQRILIVDFDVHHCNGTQSVFYETDQVLVLSIHQDRIFPFTGEAGETGSGPGRGYTINLPVHQQFGDTEYTYLLGKTLGAVVEQYMPQFILVSAGYDGHRQDSISKTLLSTAWFGNVTRMLRFFARESCGSRMLFVLEGGYNPDSLQDAVLETLAALQEPTVQRAGIIQAERARSILAGHPMNSFWTL